MILETAVKDIESNMNFQTKKFEIEANEVAFRVLTSKLYTNGIRAVIRELSCNAYDIQKEVGVDRPFEVQLPTRYDLTFSVRDFGTGLSEDEVFNLYTTLFKSTKRTSNLSVGCLGLGSKSPFAYENTDSFNVQSFQNGKLTQYICYLDQTGSPSVTKVMESDTDEPNGLKVSLPVKERDISRFKYESDYLFQFFDTPPKMINSDSEVEPIKMVDTFYLREGDQIDYFKHGDHGVVMGNIFYPLYNLQNSDAFDYSYELKQFIREYSFVVPLGTVSFAPSREELVLDKKTLDYIKQVYDEFIAHYKSWVAIQISILLDENKIREAVDLFNKNEKLPGLDEIYNGTKLCTLQPFHLKSGRMTYNYEKFRDTFNIHNIVHYFRYGNGIKRDSIPVEQLGWRGQYSRSLEIIVIDEDLSQHKTSQKIKGLIFKNKLDQVLVLSSTISNFQTVKDFLLLSNFYYTSSYTIPKPVRTKQESVKLEGKSCTTYTLVGTNWDYVNRHEPLDYTKTFYYQDVGDDVKLSYHTSVIPVTSVKIFNLNGHTYKAAKFKEAVENGLAIKIQHQLATWAEEKYSTFQEKEEFINFLKTEKTLHEYTHIFGKVIFNYLDELNLKYPTKTIADLYALVKYRTEYTQKFEDLDSVIKSSLRDECKNSEETLDTITTYPISEDLASLIELLRYVRRGSYSYYELDTADKKVVESFVKLLSEKEKQNG